MTAAQLQELFHRYVTALNERWRDEVLAIVADELVHNGVPMTGTEWWDDHIAPNVAALPDYTWAVDELIVCGDRVVIRYLDSGTVTRPWVGLTTLGQSIRFREYVIYTVQDGRIVEVWSVFDHWALVDPSSR